jgi:crossover junction endodeoxyribonuclease RusA
VAKKTPAEPVSDVFREDSISPRKFLKLSLPVPPSVNALHYNTRGGGRRLTAKAQNYIRDSRALIHDYVDEQRWSIPDKRVWLYVDMVFYFPDRRIRDASNCLKLLLDVMEGIVYHNDYIALPRIQSVEYDKEHPRVEVCVSSQHDLARKKGLKTARIEPIPAP